MKRGSSENLNFPSPQKISQSPLRNQDQMLRTSGTKPFQLSKLRQHKRSSIQLLNPGVKLDLLGYKSHQQLYDESKDVFLDLVINKKVIVDTHHNKILESERQNTFYIQSQDSMKEQFHSLSELPKIEPTDGQNQPTEVLRIFQTKQEVKNQPNETLLCNKKEKCQSCHHLNSYLSQAIISTEQKENNSYNGGVIEQQLSEKEQMQLSLNPHSQLAKLQLQYVKEKVEKSPFSFTNIKWRTKSEGLPIDKWKEKYGKPDLNLQKINSLSNIKKLQAQRVNRSQEKSVSQRDSPRKPLLFPPRKLPSLSKILESKGSLKSEQNKIVQIINEDTTNKKDSKQCSQSSSCQTSDKRVEAEVNLSLKKWRKYEQQRIPRKQDKQMQEVKTKKTESKIKESEEKDSKKGKKAFKNEKIVQTQKKNGKLPSIQGGDSKGSIKLKEQNKKKEILDSKIDFSLKEKLPRKVYFHRMMEQIPQRWQYGQSRDNSREVDAYLKIKEEQERIQLQNKEEQQRRQLQNNIQLQQEEDLKKEQTSQQFLIK